VQIAMMRPIETAEKSDAPYRALPRNVIPFPRAHRAIPMAASWQPRHDAAAEINARLLILLGICSISASSVLLAVHILHG